MKPKKKHFKLLQILFFATLLICVSFGKIVSAQNPNSLVEQKVKDYNNGNFRNAIKCWRSVLTEYKNNLLGDLYGLRIWLEYGFRQCKQELSWTDFFICF